MLFFSATDFIYVQIMALGQLRSRGSDVLHQLVSLHVGNAIAVFFVLKLSFSAVLTDG